MVLSRLDKEQVFKLFEENGWKTDEYEDFIYFKKNNKYIKFNKNNNTYKCFTQMSFSYTTGNEKNRFYYNEAQCLNYEEHKLISKLLEVFVPYEYMKGEE